MTSSNQGLIQKLSSLIVLPLLLVAAGCGGGGGGTDGTATGGIPTGSISTAVDISVMPAAGSRAASRLFRSSVGLRPFLPARGDTLTLASVIAEGQQVSGAGGTIGFAGSTATITMDINGRRVSTLINLPQQEGQKVRIVARQEGALDINQNGIVGELVPAAFVIVDANNDNQADSLFLHETLENGGRLTRSAQGVVWIDLDADGQHAPSEGDVLMADQDNDGIADAQDLDDDEDGINDDIDTDDDNDGIADGQDAIDTDNDNDGILNFSDPEFSDALIPTGSSQGLAQVRGLVGLNFLFQNQVPVNLNQFNNPYQLVNSLGDRFSAYYSTKEKASQDEAGFGGIGVGLEDNPGGGVRVRLVAGGTPAQAAGIQVGDILVAGGGVDLSQATVAESAFIIRGLPGTSILITVRRSGAVIRHTIVRALLNSGVVSYSNERDRAGVLRLVVRSFTSGVAEEVRATLNSATGVNGYILDLRGNPGGFVTEAQRMADHFLSSGVIYSFRNAANDVRTTNAQNEVGDVTLPLVVLVDGDSASASEIVAAALKENNRASVVGSTTFGKGIAQTTYTLTGGDAVKITTDFWLSPQGNNLHQIGVTPTHPATADQALNTALNLLP